MSNTRAWNSRAATLHRQQNLTRNYHRQQPSGGRTRQQPSGSRTYHDRVNLDHDFEVISARETTTTVRGIPLETPRSPQKGRTTWTIGNSWTPQDSADYGLDPSSEWFDAEVEGSVTDIRPPPGPIKDKKKRKKSRVSVSLFQLAAKMGLICIRNGRISSGKSCIERFTWTRC